MLRSLLAVSLLFGAPFVHAKEYTMKIATVAPADSPWAALLNRYKESVEKRTKGQLKIKIMLGGALGDENEAVTKTSRGQVQAVGASTGALASRVPEINVVELPYLFRSAEEADQVIDGTLTKPLEKLFADRGLVLGFWSENGYRNFFTRDKFAKKPADLKGKKMRAQESPVHIAMYKAFGASAVALPTTEVPQALATGAVDGFDQATLFAIAAGWHTSIKFATISEHIYQPAAIVFNKPWYDRLPEEMRKALVEEGRAIQTKGRQAVRAIQGELMDVLKYEKIQIHTLSPAERRGFEEAAQPVYDEFRREFPQAVPLLDAARAALARIRERK